MMQNIFQKKNFTKLITLYFSCEQKPMFFVDFSKQTFCR